jgi:ppGpp synthetase/RelA/SpoT-type nucleotidyltranferase
MKAKKAPGLTVSQVNKAGRNLRKWQRGELADEDSYNRALMVLLAYRAEHREPLAKATMGLRSMVATEGCQVEVSQRLKRVPTILDKLVREPTLQLANMQDIGGCRAVLASIDEVRRVQKRVTKNRSPKRVSDYISEPRDSGYRGVHLVVHYDGRSVEVQLRTPVMHEWAITVERLSGRLRSDLKGGSGPKEVLDLLEAISEAMALEEEGKLVDSPLIERIDSLRQEALPFLGGGPPR